MSEVDSANVERPNRDRLGPGRRPFGEDRFVGLPKRAMSLQQQIQMVSQRLSWYMTHAGSHVEFMQLNRLLEDLRAKLPPRKPRSKNGMGDIRDIQRAERTERLLAAKRRQENAGRDNGPETGSGSI